MMPRQKNIPRIKKLLFHDCTNSYFPSIHSSTSRVIYYIHNAREYISCSCQNIHHHLHPRTSQKKKEEKEQNINNNNSGSGSENNNNIITMTMTITIINTCVCFLINSSPFSTYSKNLFSYGQMASVRGNISRESFFLDTTSPTYSLI